MHSFHYRNGKLFCEGVSVQALADRHGTPLYIYSQQTLESHFQELDAALAPLDHRVCFSVKSNSNLAVLRVLAGLGAGFDIVSAGELRRVIAAGGDARSPAFSPASARRRRRSSSPCAGTFIVSMRKAGRNWRASAGSPPASKKSRRWPCGSIPTSTPTPTPRSPRALTRTNSASSSKRWRAFMPAPPAADLRLRGVQMHIGSQLTGSEPFELAVRKVLPLVRTAGRPLWPGVFQHRRRPRHRL